MTNHKLQIINQQQAQMDAYDDTHCFVITRHVNSEKTNRYWNECYSCIRKFYSTIHVIIIDDNSNHEYLKTLESTPPLHNVFFIQSEFPGRGELLPYYYLNKYKVMKTAIIIHDTVFIQQPVPEMFAPSPTPIFMWNFQHCWEYDIAYTKHLISKLSPQYVDRLLQLYENKNKWRGCFGVMSIINPEYISSVLDKTYGLFNLMQEVNMRTHRCCLERVFGLICSESVEVPNNTLLGDIHNYLNLYSNWGCDFDQYIIDKHDATKNLQMFPMIKVYSGR